MSFPETDTRFVVNGMTGVPNSGIAGMILKPWDERERSAQELNPLVQGKLAEITGEQVFAFSLPPLPGSTGGLPVQMVISSPAGYETVFRLMEEIKAAARQSGMFIVTDSDLAFNNPVVRVHVDRLKANDSMSPWPRSATRWRPWSAATTSTASISTAVPTR